MDIFAVDAAAFMSFLLTLIRISLIVFLLPFYGGETIPVAVKGALCMLLAFALWPQYSFPGETLPASTVDLVVLIIGEAFMGLVLGLSVQFIFAGIQVGGELLGMQMGFSMVSMVDPSSGSQVSVTSHILYMVSMVLFLTLNGHLFLLHALASSFELVPPGGLNPSSDLCFDVLTLSSGMFVIAIKIAAPVIAALLTVELTLALMGRAAPQMNLLTMGFPLKIAVGFFFISLIFSVLSGFMEQTILQFEPMFRKLLLDGLSI